MRYKKISPKNNQWKKTCQALKELFETLQCSKCKNSLHDSQQFLQCGHFSCFSCTKNSNKCIECQFSVNDDILKDDTIKKIVQACCTIAEQVGYKEIPHGTGTPSKANSSKKQTETSGIESNNLVSLSNHVNEDSNQSKEKPRKVLKKRKRVKKSTECGEKKAKLERMIPPIRIPKVVDRKNHHGETKLQEECKKGHIEYVKALLNAGANPNTQCAAGWTPLQECADYGFIDIATLLLNNGADINKKGYQGRTPLHEAAQADRFPMVKFLLEHNAQKDVEDAVRNKPIDFCKSEKVKLLLLSDEENDFPCTSTRFRSNNVPQSRMCDSIPEESHLSATYDVKVERECDNSNSESEDEVPDEERNSQNITTSHEGLACRPQENDNDILYDTEEIDVMN